MTGSETKARSKKTCSDATEIPAKLVKPNPDKIIPPQRHPKCRNSHDRIRNNREVSNITLQYYGNPSKPCQVRKSDLRGDTKMVPASTPGSETAVRLDNTCSDFTSIPARHCRVRDDGKVSENILQL